MENQTETIKGLAEKLVFQIEESKNKEASLHRVVKDMAYLIIEYIQDSAPRYQIDPINENTDDKTITLYGKRILD